MKRTHGKALNWKETVDGGTVLCEAIDGRGGTIT